MRWRRWIRLSAWRRWMREGDVRGTVSSIFRHPVKGLTPEPMDSVELTAGAYFPNDRLYAVEVGPSGFDPENPRHVSKMRFAVLARFPALAQVKTRFNDVTGMLHVGDAAGFGVDIPFGSDESREALARYLQAFLGAQAEQKLRVLQGPASHRFMDNARDGFVSAINLNTIRAVEQAIGKPVDPLRFRANIYYDGPPAFAETALERGDVLAFGAARLKTMKPIERCVATHVDPDTGVRDIDMVDELRTHFGAVHLGTYFSVETSGRVARGDSIADERLPGT